MARDIVETRHDRLLLAEDAGMGRVSPLSVLAGVMTAWGTFVLVLAATAGVLELLGVDTTYSESDWKQIGTGAGLVAAGVLLVSYLFGGYVAGRMSRRAGVTHGLLVFVVGLLFAGGLAALATAITDSGEVNDIERNLRSMGIPTSRSDWVDAGVITGIASLAAMLIGSLLGGSLGERWHGKLLARAVDPAYGDRDVEQRPAVVQRRAASSVSRRDVDRDRDHDVDRTDRTDRVER